MYWLSIKLWLDSSKTCLISQLQVNKEKRVVRTKFDFFFKLYSTTEQLRQGFVVQCSFFILIIIINSSQTFPNQGQRVIDDSLTTFYIFCFLVHTFVFCFIVYEFLNIVISVWTKLSFRIHM